MIQGSAAIERLDARELGVELAPEAGVGLQETGSDQSWARWPTEIQQRALVADFPAQQRLPEELRGAGPHALGATVDQRRRVVAVDRGGRLLAARRHAALRRQRQSARAR